MKVRIVVVNILVILFAAWFVPKISADRYREPILRGLESALGRKVEIGRVMFRLLLFPGFTVEDVRIGEDPAIGIEPVAYVSTLRAVPRLTALFGGPLAFSSVDLEDTSVNLTRTESQQAVRWNVSSLMRPSLLQTFPSIHMHGGRVNFKFGETKSIFYLLSTDIDLWPPTSDEGPWTFRIRTEPARTDAPARGFGSFTGRGEWLRSTGAVTLDVKLEKSQLGEVLTLFSGHDPGIRGLVSGEAHLAGPSNKVGVRARLSLADVHSWDLPSTGQRPWPISIGGAIDVPGQTIDLRATTDQAPLDIRYRVSDYLARPRWGVTANFAKLPLAPLLSISRNLGATIPADMSLAGTVEGAVGYSVATGAPKLNGQVQFADTTLGVAGTPPLKIDLAQLNFSGSTAALAPAVVKNERGETATLAGGYDLAAQRFDLAISSEGMEIASLRRQISVAGAPVLGQATSGTWSGKIQYSNLPAGWTGDLRLQDADIPFEAFAQPVHIVEADATIQGPDVTIRKLNVQVGNLRATGDYRYEAAAPRPHKFHLAMGEVDASALESLLMPALRRGSIFSYAYNFGRIPQPNWLRDMKADGTLAIGTLRLLNMPLTKLRSRVVWDGGTVKLSALQATYDKAAFVGVGSIDLGQRKPAYQLAGAVKGWAWKGGGIAGVTGGVIGGDGELSTSGLGKELVSNLKISGSFRGRGLDLSPLETYTTADGCFEWIWDAKNPKLKLSQLALKAGEAFYTGSAEMRDDGQLLFKLTDGTKQIQNSGSFWRSELLRH